MLWVRASVAVVLAVAALGLARPAPAHACGITPLGPGLFMCEVNEQIDPPCPGAGVTGTYSYWLNIPVWARNPTFTASVPCPGTVRDVTGTDNAAGGNPGAGERAFEIDFTVDGAGAGGTTPNVDLKVQYSGTPAVCIDPASGDFGQVPVGTTARRTFTVRNCGHAPLSIQDVALTGGAPPFLMSDDRCSGKILDPGDSCTFEVAFEPTQVGSYTTTVKVTDDAGNSPQTVTVKGQAVPAASGGGGAQPTPPTDVYISRFIEKGIEQDGTHQDAVVEVQITNAGPARGAGILRVQGGALLTGAQGTPLDTPYDLAPGQSFVTEAVAHLVSDDAFTLTARAIPTTPDLDLTNNGPRIATFHPPRTTIKQASPGFFSGAAHALGDLLGLYALPQQDRVTRVDVAVQRKGRACTWLRDKQGHLKVTHGRCAPHWIRATGTAKWHLRLARKLPRGRYVVLARATDLSGVRQFGVTRRTLRVR